MKTTYGFICLMFYSCVLQGQTVQERVANAVTRLQNDTQMKHAILGLSILAGDSGEKIFEINPQTGLAPASCQKIITSAVAMDLLGPGFRFETKLGYQGSIRNGTLKGNLVVIGSGDPSLGSWRFESTKEERVLTDWVDSLRKKGIRVMDGNLIGYTGNREPGTIPGGWIWDDIGNYYGAGNASLNWRENQYDLLLLSGDSIGSKVEILSMKPKPYGVSLESQLYAAEKGSGDNAYIFLPPFAQKGFVQGTIPVGEKMFRISGSFPDPSRQMIYTFYEKLATANLKPKLFYLNEAKKKPAYTTLFNVYSPVLDSLNYWFMKKSINLYGEAFLKTIAYEKTGLGSTEKGVELVKQFWKERGIEPASLHIIDGSGLSPQNRVTADALVKVLQYAKSKPWFPFYYDALPVYNGMKLKSGTIGGAKSFAGYYTAKDGTNYTIAMLINNYDGSGGDIVKKMFRVLDELK